jgi:FkbM family methyltransferase
MMIIRKFIKIARQEQLFKHPLKGSNNLIRRLRWHLHWRLNPDSPVIQELPNGMSMRLGHTSASYGMFLHQGYCDPELMETLYRYLHPGAVMFDCGAHIGEFTVAAAGALGTDCEVHAFEPDPRNFNYLKDNVARNGLTRVVMNPCAVGENAGKATFHLGKDPTASSIGLECQTVDVVRVPVVNLSEYARAHGLQRVDVLKIDVEGHELSAMKGASELLEQYKPGFIFVECDDSSNESPVSDLLASHGYKVEHRGRSGDHPHLLAYRD